jgi:flagellar protein FlaF
MNDTDLSQAPIGASKAYGAITRHTDTPRHIEYLVFAQRTAALDAANRPGASFAERIHALHDNRELWMTLAFDAASENNALPDELRANIVNLAIWTQRETDRVKRGGVPLDDLVAINQSIMQGLCPPMETPNAGAG